jgi:uncharacterized protein (TIRG00374 family)
MTAGTTMAARGARGWLLPVLWLALTVALLFTLPALPWQRTLAQFRQVEPAWIAVAVMAYFAILPLWTLEWRLLVPGAARVSFGRMFEIVSITATVLNSIPFLAGEASAVALLIARGGMSRGAALSVVAMDQLFVGLAKVSMLALAAAYAPIPDWLRGGFLSLGLLVAALALVLVPLAHRWTAIRDALLGKASALRSRLARLASWGTHLDVLRNGTSLWRVALLALAKKTAELGGVVAIQLAFGVDPSLGAALLVLAALAITTLVPVAPANLGVYEATVFGAYRYLGVPAEVALGIAVVQHVCFLLPALGTGYITLTLRQLQPRRLPVS